MTETFHDQLRHAYKASGLTQAHIAARAEVSENTVNRIMAGSSDVHARSLIAVAAVLGFQISLSTAVSQR